MECLLAVCITITAQLGFQSGFQLENGIWEQTEYIGNDYDAMIGRFNVIVDHGPVCFSVTHLSGVSVGEGDGGLNYISICHTHDWGPLYMKSAVGVQTKLANPSNDYGSIITEFALGAEFRGAFAEYSRISEMNTFMVGIKIDI